MHVPLGPDAPENPASKPRNPKYKLLLPVVLVWVGIVAFLLFVWPTPYRHEGGKNSEDIRVNRFTGREQRFDAERGAYFDRKHLPRNTSATGAGWRDAPRDSGRAPLRNRGSKGKGWWYDNSGKSRESGKGDHWWYKNEGKDDKNAPKDGWWHD